MFGHDATGYEAKARALQAELVASLILK